MTRIAWIDTAKGLGILLVAVGHASVPHSIHDYIYTFHMPLFFLLSGLTFRLKNERLSHFFQRKTLALVVPYFAFGLVTYLFWLVVGRHFGADASSAIPWYQPLWGMAYGAGVYDWLAHNPPLWFLPCFFVTELVFFVLAGRLVNRGLLLAVTAVCAVGGWLLAQTSCPPLPWGLNTVPVAVFFLAIGYGGAPWLTSDWLPGSKAHFLLAGCGLLLLLLLWLLAPLNGQVNMRLNRYNALALYLCFACLGSLACICLARALPACRLVSFIGRNTLTLFSLHLMTISVLKGILSFGFAIDLQLFQGSLLPNLLLCVVALLVLVPVSFLLNRWCPVVVGKAQQR